MHKGKLDNHKSIFNSDMLWDFKSFLNISHLSLQAFAFFKMKMSVYLLPTQWHPTPVLLPGKSHGQRSLVGCSPWGREESDTTEWLHVHFSLACIGEGNGNPLQCSCLENPRDGRAGWAAVYGVAQSRTWLKQLRSSCVQKMIRNLWCLKNRVCVADGA